MKSNLLKFAFSLVCIFFAVNASAQEFCGDFGENDFPAICVSQMGDGSSAPQISTLDIYDAAAGGAGSDGVDDVQITLEAVVCNAGCGVGGPYDIGACIGAGGNALGTTSDFAADFNNTGSGTPATTCNNSGGYICVTIDFLNGFSSTALGFDLAQSSNNGTSEGYEGSFGYVTAGTDASGAPLALPTVNLGDFCNYTMADYAAGTTMSGFLGVTGAGTYQTDVQNAIGATCSGEGQLGEDSGSASGSTNGTAAATANPNLGLTTTDIITQIKHIYFYSSTPGADCNNDGQSGANSNPSGSWVGVDFCFDPPCGFPEPAISLTEDCGTFDIVVGAIDESMASGTGTTVTYDTAFSDPWTGTNAVTGAEALTADGSTQYWINVADAAAADCNDTFGPFTAPVGNIPSCGTFPANPE